MTLERYWRPANDTGYGFHYYPDTDHYSPDDASKWLPELKSLGASWLIVLSKLESTIPEFFVRKLVADEIEPVVRVLVPPFQSVDRPALAEMLSSYANWGVHYVELFSEPNSAAQWSVEQWCRDSLVERFVDTLMPCLEEMADRGLHPVFPALRPHGDYWDLAFLRSSLEVLAAKLDSSVLERTAIAMHNHGFDRALSWGQGGQQDWPVARPYYRPAGSEDHLSFRLFEWYDEVARSVLGQSLGLLCVGSAVIGDPHSDEGGVWVDEDNHADRATSMATMLMENTVPDYVINQVFWLLATKEGDVDRGHAWYGAQGDECQAVSVLKGLLKHSRVGEDDSPQPDPPAPSPDPSSIEFVGLSEEMIAGLQVAPAQHQDQPYWKVVRVEVQPATQNMSAYAITGADGVRFSWPDGEYVAPPKDDPYAPVGAREGAASMPMFAAWGGYSAEVVGNSEVLQGFGLYGDHLELTEAKHHPVLVTFELTEGGGEDPDPVDPEPPAPDPEPDPPTPDPDPPAPTPEPDPPSPPAPDPGPTGNYGIFPRPPGDNGMGIHLGLDTRTEAMELDIRRAKEMRLTWATLCYQGEEQLARCGKMIWDAGIMPVCRQVTSIRRHHFFGRDAQVLTEIGVPAYIQIFNEPSDDREWEDGRPKGYIEKWSSLWAEKAEDVYNSGGFPGLQCLSLEEAEAAIDALGASSHIWRKVWFCSHNYGLNHPPEWQEGLWGVLGFQFFAELFQRRLGFVPPIICGEGGWLYGAYDDHRYPRVDAELHAKYTRRMLKWFRKYRLSNGELLPDYLFAVCPWILSGPNDEAWYGYTTKELTIWAVKSIKEFVRALPS
jgi:hypothetical protein